jgi:hypothetical protein
VDLLMALTPPGKFNLSFPTETETGGGEKFFLFSLFLSSLDGRTPTAVKGLLCLGFFAESAVGSVG